MSRADRGYERPPASDADVPLLEEMGIPEEKDGRVPEEVWAEMERVAWMWWSAGLEKGMWVYAPKDADEVNKVRRVERDDVGDDCGCLSWRSADEEEIRAAARESPHITVDDADG